MRPVIRPAASIAALVLFATAASCTLLPAAANASTASNRARTVRLVRNLLADVALPPGAKHRSSAPVRALHRPASTEASKNLVHHKHWFVTGGSVSHALSYARKHGVPGCRFDESGTSYGSGTTVHEIGCSARGTRYAAYVQVDIEAVATGYGTAVRADAEAVWIPARPSYSRVADAYRVHVVVKRNQQQPTVRRTLGPGKAEQLARVIDRLTVAPPVVESCPADQPGLEDRLYFRTPEGAVTATANLSGCPAVQVAVAHRPTTSLSMTGAVDRTVRRLLHLPHGYRY